MSLYSSGQHWATGYEYGWDIDSGCCHQESRHVLITVRYHNQCVKLVSNGHTFGRIGNQISGNKGILHSDVSHGNTVTYGNGWENNRYTTGLRNPHTNRVHNLIDIHVTRYDLVVGADDADHRLLHLVCGEA